MYTPLTSHLLTLGGRRSYCTVFVYVLELCVERLAVQRTSVRMLEFEPGSSAGDPPGPTTTTTSLLYSEHSLIPKALLYFALPLRISSIFTIGASCGSSLLTWPDTATWYCIKLSSFIHTVRLPAYAAHSAIVWIVDSHPYIYVVVWTADWCGPHNIWVYTRQLW